MTAASMFEWVRRKMRGDKTPEYSALRAIPTRGFPSELDAMLEAPDYRARAEIVRRGLVAAVARSRAEPPLFVSLLARAEGSIMSVTPDDGGRCALLFSTPLRAADYRRTQLAAVPGLEYLVSTPSEALQMLHDLRAGGVKTFAIDRCPRCTVVAAFSSDSKHSVDDVVNLWAISKSLEHVRADIVLELALKAAQNGEFDRARSVALEAVGHISPDDPRFHVLLGQIATRLGYRKLRSEATDYLRFLKLESWEAAFDQPVGQALPERGGPLLEAHEPQGR